MKATQCCSACFTERACRTESVSCRGIDSAEVGNVASGTRWQDLKEPEQLSPTFANVSVSVNGDCTFNRLGPGVMWEQVVACGEERRMPRALVTLVILVLILWLWLSLLAANRLLVAS